MNIKPERWCLVKVRDDLVKVMATWSGDFLEGDSWKLNSGIERIQLTKDSFLFTGQSGSVYECRKVSYGINVYGASILDEAGLQPMDKRDALQYIHSHPTSSLL